MSLAIPTELFALFNDYYCNILIPKIMNVIDSGRKMYAQENGNLFDFDFY